MTYRANLIPTLDQLASGELEPASQTFKGAVSTYRTAVPGSVLFALINQWAASLGWVEHAPTTLMGMAAQAAGLTFLQMWWSSMYVRRHRKPSVDQIDHLAAMVRTDPSLARKVALLGERDQTFFKLQRFIMKHSAAANEAHMDQALDRLDDAVEGRR